MKPIRVLLVVAALLFILFLVQGALSAETYGYVTQWGSQGSGDGQFELSPMWYTTGMAVDTSGNVYVADGGNNRIQKFTSDGTYQAQWGSSGTGPGQFDHPNGLAVNKTGFIYVADFGNKRIQKFDSQGHYAGQWSTEVPGDFEFSGPQGIAVDTSGNIYVAEMYTQRVPEIDSDGNSVTQWGYGGSVDVAYYSVGVAVDTSGNLYVLNCYGPGSLVKLDSHGAELKTWDTFGPGTGDSWWIPQSVAVDPSGNVYVTDSGNNRVQKFDADGNYVTQWGSEGSGNGQVRLPSGIVVDTSCNVSIADSGNNRVQKFAQVPPGRISVTSDPADAEIYLDGTDTLQVTPFIFDNINPADHGVYVILDGYYIPVSKLVNVTKGSTTTVDFPLQIRQSPSISVISIPAGAEIWINGLDTGKVTPFSFDMEYGTYEVAVGTGCDRYDPSLQTVIISPDAPLATITFSLSGTCPIPEFPLPGVSAVILAGSACVMLLVARRRV